MHFLGVFIEHGEHAQGAAMHRGVGDEVPRPHMAAMGRPGRRPVDRAGRFFADRISPVSSAGGMSE